MKKRMLKLHWFGNVRQNKQKDWRIRCGFVEKETNELIEADIPFGYSAGLYIGAWYDNGKYTRKLTKEGYCRTSDFTTRHTIRNQYGHQWL